MTNCSEKPLFDTVALGDGARVVYAKPGGFSIWKNSLSIDPLGEGASAGVVDGAVMRELLAGCMYASWTSSPSARSAKNQRGDKLRDYVFSLCTSYQTTHATPPTLRRARDRFLEIGDIASADCAEEKAVEETNHDVLALRDLKAMGLPAEELVARIIPRSAKSLVTLFHEMAQRDEPYAVFGYAYFLERAALFTKQSHIDEKQSLAPAKVNITRCLKVHSATGSDQSHVDEIIEFIATLPKRARDMVCQGLYETGQVMCQAVGDDPARTLLDDLLDEWNWIPFEKSCLSPHNLASTPQF